MDIGSRLAVRAIVLGLRRSGHLSSHAVLVIDDELRLAAREARDHLYEQEADDIERLSVEIRVDECSGVMATDPAPRRTLATGMPAFKL